jgi:hypothetical protein
MSTPIVPAHRSRKNLMKRKRRKKQQQQNATQCCTYKVLKIQLPTARCPKRYVKNQHVPLGSMKISKKNGLTENLHTSRHPSSRTNSTPSTNSLDSANVNVIDIVIVRPRRPASRYAPTTRGARPWEQFGSTYSPTAATPPVPSHTSAKLPSFLATRSPTHQPRK